MKHKNRNEEARRARNSMRRSGTVVPFASHRARRSAVGGHSRVSDPQSAIGRGRIQAVMLVVAVAGILLGARATYLSLSEASRYAVASEPGVTRLAQQTFVKRGDILSADGRKLATSFEARKIIATPYQIEDPSETARTLHEKIGASSGLSFAKIEAALRKPDEQGKPGGYSVVATVDPESAASVMELGLPGIDSTLAAERVYPDGALASPVVGHLGDYDESFGGVEARYDGILSAGDDVKTTIDVAVQQQLENSLSSAMDEFEAKSALGLVMRVDDGSVVALANSPGYDNADYSSTDAELQRDRVLTDPYEPGSTFKPFTVAAALEEGAVSPDDAFTVPDNILVADRVVNDSVPHEVETMYPQDILEKSSNVGTIQIAQELGGEKVDEYSKAFGFGEKTGIDLWGESAGNSPSFEDWSGSSIGNIPIGQGISVTPIQLATAYATLANGGLTVDPRITETAGTSASGDRVISEETSGIVRGMLQSVVEKGTGTHAQIPGYTVAGKTGTSQKVDPATGTYGDEYTASFIGFAPASDPEYVTLIVVDEPQTSIWGERVAAPAFAEVTEFTLKYFNVRPDDNASSTE